MDTIKQLAEGNSEPWIYLLGNYVSSERVSDFLCDKPTPQSNFLLFSYELYSLSD